MLTHAWALQVETRIHCPLSAMQTFWYRRLLLKDSALLKSIEADATKDGSVRVGGFLAPADARPESGLEWHACIASWVAWRPSCMSGRTCRRLF